MDAIVSRAKGVSAAFIKELMRRCAQFRIEFARGDILEQSSVDAAIEEALFAGGALNRRLLGGEGGGLGIWPSGFRFASSIIVH